MKKKKLFKMILSFFVGLLLIILVIDVFCPGLWWIFKFRGNFRNADQVELFSYKTEQRVIIEDKGEIRKLWKAMDILSFKPAEFSGDTCLAYIAYDIGVDLGFPIYIYDSGVALWGMPPDDDRCYYMPDLRDAVIELCEKYNIEINVEMDNKAEE